MFKDLEAKGLRFPRSRGDEPIAHVRALDLVTFSPLTRG